MTQAQPAPLDNQTFDHQLIDSLPNLVFVVDWQGRIERTNAAWREYSGASEGAEWLSFVYPEDAEKAVFLYKDGRPSPRDVRLRGFDGAYRWHRMHVVPLDQQGRRVVSATDIDRRRRFEEKQNFFSRAMQVMGESLNYNQTLPKLVRLLVPSWADICSVDVIAPDGSVQRLEAACSREEELPTVRHLRVRDWLAAPGSRETVAQVLRRGESVYVPSVTPEWIASVAPPAAAAEAERLGVTSAMVVPLRARHTTMGALAVVSAESGRSFTPDDLRMIQAMGRRAGIAIENGRLHATSRRITRDLRAANRARDEFLSLMSHEMRTPLTTIFGNAQVLRRLFPTLDEEAISASLDDIKADASRMQLVVENLLTLARTSDTRASQVEPVLVAHFMERQRTIHARRYPKRQIDLDIGDGVCVSANEPAFELILRNILDNAEKYSPPQEPITITADYEKDHVVVRVLDHGPGIAVAEAEEVFGRFFRSPLTRELVSGVGIGLTVCRHLVDASGGRIWAREREGGGCEIGFTMPAEREVFD